MAISTITAPRMMSTEWSRVPDARGAVASAAWSVALMAARTCRARAAASMSLLPADTVGAHGPVVALPGASAVRAPVGAPEEAVLRDVEVADTRDGAPVALHQVAVAAVAPRQSGVPF